MTLVMNLNAVVVAATALLLTVLLVVYGTNMRQAPSRFTGGLFLFGGALWFQAVVQLYFFATMMPLYAGGVEKLVLVQNLLVLVGSGVLLAVTLRPISGRNLARSDTGPPT